MKTGMWSGEKNDYCRWTDWNTDNSASSQLPDDFLPFQANQEILMGDYRQ